jgi:phage terminase large subunit
MAAANIDLGYRERPQFKPFHARKQRWACIVAHRRAGKTVACIMALVDAALRGDKPDGRYAYIAPFYAQAKDVAWSYLKRYTGSIPGVKVNESELRIDLHTGARIRLYGADNYERLRGLYFDGIVLDEYADMDPRAWPEVIRATLTDRKGWCTFIGTPKGRNSFYDIWAGNTEAGWAGAINAPDSWFSLMLKASDTGLVDAEELADAQRAMTPEQYNQEFECSFDAAIVGAYYGRQIADLENRKLITAVPWDRSIPVQTSWDLGIDDATAIWFFQTVGREIRVIDYYEINNQGLDETARYVLSRPYLYGTHYLPHDIAIRELISGKSRQETLEGLGLYGISAGVACNPVERINAVRMILSRCVFDARQCGRGLEVLKNYRREWDDKRKTFRERPLHDWSSHGADAFGEFAVNHQGRIERMSPPRKRANLAHLAS